MERQKRIFIDETYLSLEIQIMIIVRFSEMQGRMLCVQIYIYISFLPTRPIVFPLDFRINAWVSEYTRKHGNDLSRIITLLKIRLYNLLSYFLLH